MILLNPSGYKLADIIEEPVPFPELLISKYLCQVITRLIIILHPYTTY